PSPVRVDIQVLPCAQPENGDGGRVVASGENHRILPRRLVKLDGGKRHEVRPRGESDAAVRAKPELSVALAVEGYDVLIEGRAGHRGALNLKTAGGLCYHRAAAPPHRPGTFEVRPANTQGYHKSRAHDRHRAQIGRAPGTERGHG